VNELRGKSAVITGAASGIGRCLAQALAHQGTRLTLLDVNEAGLAAVASELNPLVPTRTLNCDLTSTHQVSQAVSVIQQGPEPIDILINNAGVAYYGPTERMSADQWDWLLRINLLAPIQLTHELLPALLSRPQAHILNVCSIAGLIAGRRLAAYHVSKFGLVGFSEALRAEYCKRGLGVTALCPGLVWTPLLDNAVGPDGRRPRHRPPRWLCVTPERVAAKAVDAIRANRGLVLVSAMAHALWYCKRFLPGLVEFANNYRRSAWKPPAPPPAQRQAA
jgi:short-subunit dehydrogenase